MRSISYNVANYTGTALAACLSGVVVDEIDAHLIAAAQAPDNRASRRRVVIVAVDLHTWPGMRGMQCTAAMIYPYP